MYQFYKQLLHSVLHLNPLNESVRKRTVDGRKRTVIHSGLWIIEQGSVAIFWLGRTPNSRFSAWVEAGEHKRSHCLIPAAIIFGRRIPVSWV